MTPEKTQSLADAAYQLPDRPGFRFRGAAYAGFHDRPELPTEVRRQIARWAYQRSEATFDQMLLAAEPQTEAIKDDSLYGRLERERDLLGNSQFQAVLGLLTEDELRRVLRPHDVLERDLAWPLTISEAAKVIGSITANQLRDWDDADLIKPVRYGNGDYRGYFRSHLVKAFLVEKSLDAKWSITGIKHWAGIDPVDPRDPAEAFKGLIILENGPTDIGPDVLQGSLIKEPDAGHSGDVIAHGEDQVAKRS